MTREATTPLLDTLLDAIEKVLDEHNNSGDEEFIFVPRENMLIMEEAFWTLVEDLSASEGVKPQA